MGEALAQPCGECGAKIDVSYGIVENQIPDTMRARNLTREQVMNDVLLAAQPTKRFVTVDEVASLALYLTSDGAASVTGSNLSMDGGWTAA